MLLGSSLKEKAAVWTASFKKSKCKKNNKNHQKQLDTGLKKPTDYAGFFLRSFLKVAVWMNPRHLPQQQGD